MKEKQSRYETVGNDHSTADTVRTELVNDAALFTASLWSKHKADQPFDRTFWTNGKRVQVIIREVREEHTGKATG